MYVVMPKMYVYLTTVNRKTALTKSYQNLKIILKEGIEGFLDYFFPAVEEF
jgi:hypothetical protein